MKRSSTSLILLLCVVGVSCQDTPHVVYENGKGSERTLPFCTSPQEACNIVRLRFWLPRIVQRLCKCPDRRECPNAWAKNDRNTAVINARAQMKFCSRIKDLDSCKKGEVAATINEGADDLKLRVKCYCPQQHYFQRLYGNTIKSGLKQQYYACYPLKQCQTGDFCGHIAATSYETYHVCTCPPGNICVMQDRQQHNIQEYLYEGPAYKGHCIKW